MPDEGYREYHAGWALFVLAAAALIGWAVGKLLPFIM